MGQNRDEAYNGPSHDYALGHGLGGFEIDIYLGERYFGHCYSWNGRHCQHDGNGAGTGDAGTGILPQPD